MYIWKILKEEKIEVNFFLINIKNKMIEINNIIMMKLVRILINKLIGISFNNRKNNKKGNRFKRFNNQSKRRNYFNKSIRNRNKKENLTRIIMIIIINEDLVIIKIFKYQ